MIPVSGISVIALLAVKMRVNPCAYGIGDELAGIVCGLPLSRLAQP